ncbi:MAG TPA: hypothetical protein V6C58_17460 [Allocoleopsis sp.]
MSKASLGKSLKGVGTLSSKFLDSIEDSIFNSISSGGIDLSNVNITGGTIDGVTIGNDEPGPGNFTTLQTGNPTGVGFDVCFYGQTVGDHACWEAIPGLWNINGDLYVRDISDLGNLRISGNTVSSTNTNGNIVFDPNGTGFVNILSGITQSTSLGDISFNTSSGSYSLNVSNTISTVSGSSNTTQTSNGDITLQTGTSIPTRTISNISIGSIPTITTTVPHSFLVGDTVVISGTNSVPNINGTFTVLSTPTSNTITISPGFTVTSIGSTGSVYRHNDINLNATNNVNIPNNVGLTFGSDTRKISSDSTNLIVDVGIGNLVINNTQTTINGDLLVNGTTTRVESTIVTIDDPVLTLGGDTPPVLNDFKDRGIEARYHDGISAKIAFFGLDNSDGCFTYISDATNTSEIFSGSPGKVCFGEIKGTSLNLQGGTITNVGSLNTCNVSCSGSMSISATTDILFSTPLSTFSGNIVINGSSTSINSSTVSISDLIPNIGTNTNDSKDRGISFSYNDGSSKTGFIGYDQSDNCFTFIADATITDNVVSGSPGNVCFGNTEVNNLTISGQFAYSTEHISTTGGGSVSPTNNKNITFVTVSSSGIATGTLSSHSVDGFSKHIFIESLATGASYELSCGSGILLDPGSGTTTAKTLQFSTAGQSIHLVWSSTINAYMIVNGGACII